MAPLIEENRTKLYLVCKEHKLKYLYIFGSAARGIDFTAESDIDFLYAFDKGKISLNGYADNFFNFLFRLEDLFKRKIDLVLNEKIKNPYFLKQVDSDKILVYGNN